MNLEMNDLHISLDEADCKSILDYESNIAREIALALLEKPKLSPWMILVPIIILPFMMRQQRYKDSTKIFCEGYLHTKRIALDTACRLYHNRISREEAKASIKRRVENTPEANACVTLIYQLQIAEVEFLTTHYLGLLSTKEDNYAGMVLSCYQTKNSYLSFINRLTKAEKEVSQAAYTTFQDENGEVITLLEKMDHHLVESRLKQANAIFRNI